MAVTNNFASSTLDLNGVTTISGPTALVWGPDGRLYVTEVGGTVKVLTVAFGDPDPTDGDPIQKFYVESAFDLTSVIGFNFNDDGGSNPTVSEQGRDRQVTGIDVVQQYNAAGDPVFTPDGKPAVDIYVTSSDPRHGAGSNGGDKNLDTNSGVVHRLREVNDVASVSNPEDAFETVDLVRGFARSEENHSINGLEIIQEFDSNGKLVSERAIVAVGGNANNGAPSNNFAAQPEYATSAAIFEIDITMLDGMNVQTDETSPGVFRDYIYDLPTLDDPSQTGTNDVNDPFGGNDGFNGTILLSNSDPNNPVTMYSPGYRNAYDVEVTEDGRVWTYDNGANNTWGGRPIGEAGDNGGIVDFLQDPNYIATNLNNGDGNSNDEISLENWDPSNNDNFHEITRSDDLGTRSLSVGGNGAVTTYIDPDTNLELVYGGHPNPTRAEGSKAGLLYSPGGTDEDSFLLVSDTNSDGGPLSDYEQVIAWFTQVEANDADYPTQGVYGADAGELTNRVIEATPGVLYDIYEEVSGKGLAVPAGAAAPSPTATFIGSAGLPADIHDVVATTNPVEGDYLEAGATDGALDSGGGSINGLAEYTSTILDQLPGISMSGAILASQFNGGGIIVMGRNADGTMSSVSAGNGTLAADRTVIADGAQTLGLATIGDNIAELGLSSAFQGSIWLASYKIGSNFEVSLEVLQPEGVGIPIANQAVAVTDDQDGDGVDYINDPFDFSPDNGYQLAAGETINIDFEANDTTSFPGSFGGIGLLGASLDGVTPNQDAQTATEFFPPELIRDGLFNDGENLIPGGNAPVFQIKDVVAGTVVGSANTARDAMHTGIKLDPGVTTLVATTNVKNWVSSGLGGAALGQVTGMMFSDGTQSNFLRVVFGGVNTGGTNVGIEVGIELGDANYTVLGQVEIPQLLLQANQEIELRLAVSNIGTTYDVSVQYKMTTDADFVDVPLNGGSGFQLPGGVLQNVLDGTHTISDGDGPTLTSGAAIGILAETTTTADPLLAIDFNSIVIEGFANGIFADTGAAVGTGGSSGVDTIIYTGTDTVLAPLAADVENFDGSGSSVNYTVTGNALNNRIELGLGANTVTTGAGSDTILGTIAQLSGDEITDMSVGDTLVITDLSTADASGATYSDGPAQLTIGGGTITFSGPDFAGFEANQGPAVFKFADGAEGLEVTVSPQTLNQTVLYRINFGADGTIAAVDDGPDWLDDNSAIPGFSTDATGEFSTKSKFLTVEFDNVDPNVVPADVFNSERGDFDGSDAPSQFNFDVEAGKSYRIELFYTENWQGSFTAPARIFSVSVDGSVPNAFQNLEPLAAAEAFVVANGGPTIAEAIASGGTFTDDEKNLFMNVGLKAEHVYTAVDDQINLALLHVSQNPKLNAIQISEIDTSNDVILVSIVDAPPATETGDVGSTNLTFQLEVADQGFTGDLTLSYDVTIGETTQSFLAQTVAFTDSDASISVSVPNDIQNNGEETVLVTLIGIAETGYQIDGAAATGTSAVTEDDAPLNPGFPFSEATDGDLSDERFNPTDLGALAVGDNFVTATQQGDAEPGGRERDYFTFEVPTGQVLTQLILADYVAGEPLLPQGFMGLAAGPIMDVDPLTLETNIPNLLGGKVYSEADIGQNILPDFADGAIVGNVTTAGFTLPLTAGTYTLWLNQGGEASTPTINLTSVLASDLTQLSIANAPDVLEAGDTGTTELVFPLSISPAAATTLEVVFTVDGGEEQTQSVVFDATGAGSLTVDVANDNAFTGDRGIDVSLNGADSGTPGAFVVINDAAATAIGTVLEDDTQSGSTAPSGDFDNDGIPNQSDTDIDGDASGSADNSTSLDGILNIQETFIFDPTNSGTALTAGQVVRQEFDVDGTPFMNGFTGALLSPTNGSSEIDLSNAFVSGGTLNVTATNGDHFEENNTQQNAFVAAYTSPEGISVETRFAIPDFDSATDGIQAPSAFQAAGVVVGIDQNNLVKAVWGRAEPAFQLVQDFGGSEESLTAGSVPTGAVELSIKMSVFADGSTGLATASAVATFYDASGVAIPGSTDIDLGTITLANNAGQGGSMKDLVESGAPLGAGVIQTSTNNSAPDSFLVSYEYVEVAALGTPQVGDEAPTVELTNVLASVPENQDLATSFKVADITINDDGLSTVTPLLTGEDVVLFEIVDNGGELELHLKPGAALDFETNATINVTVEATDAVGTGTAAFSALVTDANDAPTISGTIADSSTPQGTPTNVDLLPLVLADEDAADVPTLKVLIDGIDVGSVAGFSLNGSTLDVDGSVAIGNYTIEVFATDGTLDSVTPVAFEVDVVDPGSSTVVRGDVLQAYNAGGGTVSFGGIDFAGSLDGGPIFAGGENYTDPLNGNNGNQVFDNLVFETEINGGEDDDSTPGFFTATLSVPQDQVFLDLYFSEVYFPNVGSRIFDIAVNGEEVISNLDILAQVGGDPNTPLIIELPEPVAPDSSGNIVLTFTADVDRAKLSALVVREAVSGSNGDTAPMVALQNQVIELPENTDVTASVKVADIVITDDGQSTVTPLLSGTDSGLFEIVENLGSLELHISAGAELDFETNAILNVTVEASDAAGTGTAALSVALTDTNDAPVLVPENVQNVDLLSSQDAIAPIDASAYFDDPDLANDGSLEVLFFDAAGLPPDWDIDPNSGEITGTPDTPGTYTVVVTATDTGDLSATATVTITVTEEPVSGDAIRVQVEAFDNIPASGGFFVETQLAADADQVARLGANENAEATLALDGVTGFVPGTFDLALGFFDENDGDSTVTVKLRTTDGGTPNDTVLGTILFDADDGGNAAQASSFREVTLNGITLPAGGILVLEGQAEGYNSAEAALDPDRTVGNEFVRLDYVALVPTSDGGGQNSPPVPTPGFNTSLEAPEGSADFSVSAAFNDPDQDALTFGLAPIPAGDPVPTFLAIDPSTGVISMTNASVSADTTFDFLVTATDLTGSGQQASQTFSLTVANTVLPSVAANVATSVVEGINSIVTVGIANDPVLADDVTVRLNLVAGTSSPAATPGIDVAFDDFGATTVDVTFAQGTQGVVPLVVADDGPIDDLESFRVEIVAANTGSTIDPTATALPFAQFSNDSTISDADDAPVAVGESQEVAAGGEVTFDPTASDTDSDATALTLVAIDDSATFGGTVTQNANGTVTVTAAPDAPSTITFGYTVADNFGNESQGVETISVMGAALSLIAAAPTATAVEDGDAGSTAVTIGLTVAPAASATVDVDFSLDGGTTIETATVTFDGEGKGSLVIDIAGFNDDVDNGNDTATVTLVDTSTSGFDLDPLNSVSIVTITEDDAAQVETIALRINAFGEDQAATDGGLPWLGDVDGGGAAGYLQVADDRGDAPSAGYSGDPTAIPDGLPEEVLDTARSSDQAFSYAIPVFDIGGPGTYRINLYISELYGPAQSGNFRIFDSSLEGVVPTAFNNIDPGNQFGADVGVLTADVAVEDGTLNIAFIQDVVQNPIVNGIEIIKLVDGTMPMDPPPAAEPEPEPIPPAISTEPEVVEPIADLILVVGNGTTFDASLAFADEDGDDLDFEIEGPAGLTIDPTTGVVTVASTLAAGTYQATVTASDDDENEAFDTFNVTLVEPAASGSVSVSIAGGSGDWEQFGGSGSSDFELGQNAGTQQWAALQFTGLDIPTGAAVTSAVIRFTAQGDSPGTGVFEVAVEDTETSAPFNGSNSPAPSNRVYVDEFVWTETVEWLDGQTYDTPDLTDQLAGVIGNDGVEDGSIAFIFQGVSGSKVADAFNTPDGDEAELIITYDFV